MHARGKALFRRGMQSQSAAFVDISNNRNDEDVPSIRSKGSRRLSSIFTSPTSSPRSPASPATSTRGPPSPNRRLVLGRSTRKYIGGKQLKLQQQEFQERRAWLAHWATDQKMQRAVQQFNTSGKPHKLLRAMQQEELIPSCERAIAWLLRVGPGKFSLSRKSVGEVLGEPPSTEVVVVKDGFKSKSEYAQGNGYESPLVIAENRRRVADSKDKHTDDDRPSLVLQLYAKSFHFIGAPFILALRYFLSRFELPGEAQKISRVLTAFADVYHRDNPSTFRTADGAFLLAYSVVMLNVDAHNPNLAHAKRMSRAEFVANNRGIDGGGNVDEKVLQAVYDSIKGSALQVATSVPAKPLPGQTEVCFRPGPIGLTLETGYANHCVVVKKMVAGGQASKKCLRPGFELVAINGESVMGRTFEFVMWQIKHEQVQSELEYSTAAWPATTLTPSEESKSGWLPLVLRFSDPSQVSHLNSHQRQKAPSLLA